jgi:hypothetical protein
MEIFAFTLVITNISPDSLIGEDKKEMSRPRREMMIIRWF